MSWFTFKSNKERERFYLLPGQGGAEYRRKLKYMLIWSTLLALLFSGALTALFLYMDRVHR
jgi:hypothetical protein